MEVAFSELRIGGQHLFTGIIRDVSERKRTEDALRSSERRFSIAFNANPMSSTISTLDGRFLDANEQFLRTAGYSREEVVGRTANELGLWRRPQDRDRADAAVARGGHGPRVRGGPLDQERTKARPLAVGGTHRAGRPAVPAALGPGHHRAQAGGKRRPGVGGAAAGAVGAAGVGPRGGRPAHRPRDSRRAGRHADDAEMGPGRRRQRPLRDP